MHFLPGYCWKYGAEYFLWCFKPICSGNLIAGPCALHSCFQFAVAWSATHSSWDAPKWEVLRGAGNTKTQGTRNISLGSSREAASFKGLFYEKSLLVGDGGTVCASSDFVSGQEKVDSWVLLKAGCWTRSLAPPQGQTFLTREICCTDDGLWLSIHHCFKCDNIQLHKRTACGLGSRGWDTRCLLYRLCSRDSCVLGNMCGKVSAIAVGILKIEAVFLAPNQILGVAAGVESVEKVCWSGYNNTHLFVMLLGVLTRFACLQRRSYCVPCRWARRHCASTLLLDTITLSMSKYHRAALKRELPQAQRDLSLTSIPK